MLSATTNRTITYASIALCIFFGAIAEAFAFSDNYSLSGVSALVTILVVNLVVIIMITADLNRQVQYVLGQTQPLRTQTVQDLYGMQCIMQIQQLCLVVITVIGAFQLGYAYMNFTRLF